MSSKITTDEILKLAILAKLALSEEEIQRYQGEIEALLGYFDKLDSLDLDGVQPTLSVHGRTSAWREDIPQQQLAQPDALMQLPPHKSQNQIQVKRMI